MSDERRSEDSPSDQSRADEILGQWRAARDCGEAIDREALLAAHPDLRMTLQARLEAMDALEAAFADPTKRGGALRAVADDRYDSFRVLGLGGMGIVYWALDSDLNRQVAFKVIRPDAGMSGTNQTPESPITMQLPSQATPVSQAFETLKARFLQEAWVTAGLEHPGIVPVYEVGQTREGVPYYTMQFVRGNRTLAKSIEDLAGRPMDERLQLLDAFLKVCDTIRYAHAHGVIHRDLKPENIAIGEFGEVVVLDWGLAKMQGSIDATGETWQARLHEFRDVANLHTVASAMGTPGYMAPEAATGKIHEVDEQSDVYSLGAILFEIVTGSLPHKFKTYVDLLTQLLNTPDPDPSLVDASTPPELAAICTRALAKDRAERTPSVDALAAAIRTWLAQRDADRELEAFRQQARAAFDAAAGLTGDLRLHQLDRAAALCTQVLAKRSGDTIAAELQRKIDALRARGIAERERATRGRTLRRAGIAALVIAVVAGAVVAKVLEDRRQEADDARADTAAALAVARIEKARADQERDAAAAAERRAAAERDRARVVGLVSASAAASARDPMLALLLANEARARSDDVAVRQRLRAALSTSLERKSLRDAEGHIESVTCNDAGTVFLARSMRMGGWAVRAWGADGRTLGAVRGGGLLTDAGLADGGSHFWVRGAGVSGVYRIDGTPLGSARDLVFGANAEHIVALGGAAPVLLTLGGSPLAQLSAHASATSAEFCQDGRRLVTFDASAVVLWDTEGRELARLAAGDDPHTCFALSRDAARIAVGCRSGAVRIWSPGADGAVTDSPASRESPVKMLAISRDAGLVVAQSEQRSISIWRADGTLCGSVEAGDDAVLGPVVLSPSGDALATFDTTSAKIHDITGAVIGTVSMGVNSFMGTQLEFSPEGGRLLALSMDSFARVVDYSGRELLVLRGHSGALRAGTWTADGGRIVTGSLDGTVRFWDTIPCESRWAFQPQRSLEPPLLGRAVVHPVPTRDAFFSLDADHTVRVRAANGSVLAALRAGEGEITHVAAAPNGIRIATGSTSGEIRVHDLSGGPHRDLEGLEAPARDLEYSWEGDRIVAAATDGSVCAWTLDGERVAAFAAPGAELVAARSAGDGGRFLTRHADHSVRIRDAQGREIAAILGGGQVIADAEFSRDGSAVLTSPGGGGDARLWSVDGKLLTKFELDAADAARFLPGDERVLVQGRDAIAVFRIDGTLVTTFTPDAGWIMSAELSPAGDRCVTTTWEGVITIWDLDGHEHARFATDTMCEGAVFSGTGDSLLVASWGASVVEMESAGEVQRADVWTVGDASLRALAALRTTRTLDAAERRVYADLLGTPALSLVDAQAHLKRGLAALDAGRLDDALTELRAAAEWLEPRSSSLVRARAGLARAHVLQAVQSTNTAEREVSVTAAFHELTIAFVEASSTPIPNWLSRDALETEDWTEPLRDDPRFEALMRGRDVSARPPTSKPASTAKPKPTPTATAPVDDDVLRARVRAIRLADDDGARRADISPAEVATWLAKANEIYAAAKIELVFDPEADLSDARSTLVNSMAGAADARWWESVAEGNRLAAEYPGHIVILFRHGPGESPTGGGFSATQYNFVAMPGFRHTSVCGHQNITIVAHEVGHYLGLQHTFARNDATVADAEAWFLERGKDPGCFDGDGLADTPPDPFIRELQCGTASTVTLGGVELPLPRANIMSYWEAPTRTLSPTQARNMRWTLRQRMRGGGALPVNTGAIAPLEAESFRIVERQSCNAAPQKMDAFGAHRWSGGSQLWCGGTADAVLTLELATERTGRCRVDLYGTRGPAFARAQVSFDGQHLGEPVEFYAPTVQPTGAIALGTVTLDAGSTRRITLTITGRDDRAASYGFGIDCIDLVPIQ